MQQKHHLKGESMKTAYLINNAEFARIFASDEDIKRFVEHFKKDPQSDIYDRDSEIPGIVLADSINDGHSEMYHVTISVVCHKENDTYSLIIMEHVAGGGTKKATRKTLHAAVNIYNEFYLEATRMLDFAEFIITNFTPTVTENEITVINAANLSVEMRDIVWEMYNTVFPKELKTLGAMNSSCIEETTPFFAVKKYGTLPNLIAEIGGEKNCWKISIPEQPEIAVYVNHLTGVIYNAILMKAMHIEAACAHCNDENEHSESEKHNCSDCSEEMDCQDCQCGKGCDFMLSEAVPYEEGGIYIDVVNDDFVIVLMKDEIRHAFTQEVIMALQDYSLAYAYREELENNFAEGFIPESCKNNEEYLIDLRNTFISMRLQKIPLLFAFDKALKETNETWTGVASNKFDDLKTQTVSIPKLKDAELKSSDITLHLTQEEIEDILLAAEGIENISTE